MESIYYNDKRVNSEMVRLQISRENDSETERERERIFIYILFNCINGYQLG